MMSSQDSKGRFDETTPISHAFGVDDEDGKRGFFQRIPKRHVLAFLAFLGFSNVYILRTNLSVAIVAMTNDVTITSGNGTRIVTKAEFSHWDSKIQGYVLSSFFYGYIFTQLPGGFFAKRFGGKNLFGGGICCTALLTIVTPSLAKWNVWVLVGARVLEGFLEGVTFPASHTIWSRWAPPLERTKLATTAFSGSYFGAVVSMIFSGLLAHYVNWESVFYVTGAIGIVWFVLWTYLVSDSPGDHSTISDRERDYIESSIGHSSHYLQEAVPWKAIFTSLPVWAIVVAHTGENWGFYTFLTGLPTFMNDILKFSLAENGFLSALPYAFMTVMTLFAGQLADVMRSRFHCNTTLVRKTFNGIAFLAQGVFLIVTGYIMEPAASVACVTLAVGVGGFCYAGFGVNHLDIAPQYAGITMGISNTFATLPGIISPIVIGHIVTDKTADQWRIIFFLAASIYILAMIFYVVFSSGDVQDWAQTDDGYRHYTTTAPIHPKSPETDDEETEK